jgi:hypothetical protein
MCPRSAARAAATIRPLVKKTQARKKSRKKTPDGRRRCVEGVGRRPQTEEDSRRKHDFQTG